MCVCVCDNRQLAQSLGSTVISEIKRIRGILSGVRLPRGVAPAGTLCRAADVIHGKALHKNFARICCVCGGGLGGGGGE